MEWRRTLVLAALAASVVAASPERGDPAARLSAASDALEYWDFTARFEQGYRLVARVLITNEGPGDRTAVGVGHLLLPDGEIVEFHNGRREERWSIAPNGRSLRIGSTRLSFEDSLRHLEYDNHRRGIALRMDFHAEGPAHFQRSGELAGYSVDLLDLATPVEGTVLLPGMKEPLSISGRAALTHTWMDETEAHLVLRRIDFTSLDAGSAMYLRDVTDPEGKSHRWMALVRGGELLFESSDLSIALEGAAEGSKKGYPVPKRLRIQAPGLSGEVALERKIVEHEPLGDLPQPFRFLLSFATRPRRVWTDSPFSLRVDAAPGRSAIEIQGNGITSVTYLNPLPSPMAELGTGPPGAH